MNLKEAWAWLRGKRSTAASRPVSPTSSTVVKIVEHLSEYRSEEITPEVLSEAIASAGYTGPYDVELLATGIWARLIGSKLIDPAQVCPGCCGSVPITALTRYALDRERARREGRRGRESCPEDRQRECR